MDSGEYTCVARTELDNATESAYLIVQDVPNPPKVTSVSCGSQDATVEWQHMGDNRSPIMYYTIEYNTSFTPDVWEIGREVPAWKNTCKIPLSPWANYTFRVLAHNKIGISRPSNYSDVVCTTPPDIPYKNPDNDKCSWSTPNNLVIQWTPMPEIDHNGPNFGYHILWKPDEEDNYWIQTATIGGWNRSQYTVENLRGHKSYLISVSAMNEIGRSKLSPTKIRVESGENND